MGSTHSAVASGVDGLGLKAAIAYGIKPHPESMKKLEYFIKGNHFNYGILFNGKRYHNHVPHILISAYFLGATPAQLADIYENGSKILSPWKEDSPAVLTPDDWKDFRGRKQYERGFFDYFTDQITDSKSNWKTMARKFFVDDKDNLLIGLYGGLFHPLIHLGYAVEADSSLLGIEGK
jgi:hypothetical protein